MVPVIAMPVVPIETWSNVNTRTIVRIGIAIRIWIPVGHRESDANANRDTPVRTWRGRKCEAAYRKRNQKKLFPVHYFYLLNIQLHLRREVSTYYSGYSGRGMPYWKSGITSDADILAEPPVSDSIEMGRMSRGIGSVAGECDYRTACQDRA